MFYYRITITRTAGTRVMHREYLAAREVGEAVADLLGDGAHSVKVEKINQAAYVRATRPGE